ncbi:MAG: hypothetical protein HY810_04690, partial [Candidatus Omnitrophica bacterium]|nr:hypothetical protein [Candidatus Omnitrophota bacterium]
YSNQQLEQQKTVAQTGQQKLQEQNKPADSKQNEVYSNQQLEQQKTVAQTGQQKLQEQNKPADTKQSEVYSNQQLEQQKTVAQTGQQKLKIDEKNKTLQLKQSEINKQDANYLKAVQKQDAQLQEVFQNKKEQQQNKAEENSLKEKNEQIKQDNEQKFSLKEEKGGNLNAGDEKGNYFLQGQKDIKSKEESQEITQTIKKEFTEKENEKQQAGLLKAMEKKEGNEILNKEEKKNTQASETEVNKVLVETKKSAEYKDSLKEKDSVQKQETEKEKEKPDFYQELDKKQTQDKEQALVKKENVSKQEVKKLNITSEQVQPDKVEYEKKEGYLILPYYQDDLKKTQSSDETQLEAKTASRQIQEIINRRDGVTDGISNSDDADERGQKKANDAKNGENNGVQ